MANFMDRLGDRLGVLSAWMFFAVGGMIGYEVVARYVFVAPTIWAEEMSRFFQIWATYLAAASLLHRRELIRITMVTNRLGDTGRRMAEVVSLAIIAAFSAVAIWYGTDILRESIAFGRATSTMLSVPRWMTESAIPLGFGILFLQCLVEIARVLRPPPEDAVRPPGRA